ncbi:hypothetical protein HXZ94_07395 [Empedobacter falsenii]|uniref:DUF7710 domain-containing protein n=1 Tax=Empedobacter falsenii TaxID=343874 RepID=UPI002576937D|nr:hypothetical protein [Empedobacter falsenii]MDM1298325.1 hypothetical protein [Empedobacter falsenii]MDM1318118.1 hypothetical protein [Empedobacter falsenii]
MENTLIYVFNGLNASFPSAVFSSYENAEQWIKQHRLSGTLTAYPLDISAYDWAVENKYFKPKSESDQSAKFISRFSSAYLQHDILKRVFDIKYTPNK